LWEDLKNIISDTQKKKKNRQTARSCQTTTCELSCQTTTCELSWVHATKPL